MIKVFIDTNILLYCLDRHDPGKQARARELLKEAAGNLTGVVSTQVLQEFYVAATRKLHVDPLQAKTMVQAFGNLETILITPDAIANAIDCSVLNKISFWDALVVVAAESAACATLWTEDLSDGQVIRGVKIQNPLTSS